MAASRTTLRVAAERPPQAVLDPAAPLKTMACMRSAESSATWERVHTVNAYYDGPELGLANFRGSIHIYERDEEVCERNWETLDRTGERPLDQFWLRPIDPAVAQLILEEWQLFLKWDAVRRAGGELPDYADHDVRVLPEDLGRCLELKTLIGDQLEFRQSGLRMCGEFGSAQCVRWSPIP